MDDQQQDRCEALGRYDDLAALEQHMMRWAVGVCIVGISLLAAAVLVLATS